MKSDTAMWASKAISDHLRLGVSIEETRLTFVSRVLAAIMLMCDQELDERWVEDVKGQDRELIMLLIVRVTGRTTFELTEDIGRHIDDVRQVLAAPSWEGLGRLPDRVWDYIAAATGMTREEWEELPIECGRILSRGVECPVCARVATMEQFGEPDTITDPLDLHAREISLVLNCSECHARVAYDIQRRDSEEFGRPLTARSPAIKYMLIAVAVVVAYFVIRIIFR